MIDKFTPSEDYKELKKQSLALFRLVEKNKTRIENEKAKFQIQLRRIFKKHKEELDSEREMNATLTKEIITLEDKIIKLERKLKENDRNKT